MCYIVFPSVCCGRSFSGNSLTCSAHIHKSNRLLKSSTRRCDTLLFTPIITPLKYYFIFNFSVLFLFAVSSQFCFKAEKLNSLFYNNLSKSLWKNYEELIILKINCPAHTQIKRYNLNSKNLLFYLLYVAMFSF